MFFWFSPKPQELDIFFLNKGWVFNACAYLQKYGTYTHTHKKYESPNETQRFVNIV